MIYNLLADRWELSTDTDVNYMVLAEKRNDACLPKRGTYAPRQIDRASAATAVLPMFDSWLWAVFTLLAAAGQTARNAMQRELTASLGTVGATHVRFLFGFPFALVFLAGVGW